MLWGGLIVKFIKLLMLGYNKVLKLLVYCVYFLFVCVWFSICDDHVLHGNKYFIKRDMYLLNSNGLISVIYIYILSFIL